MATLTYPIGLIGLTSAGGSSGLPYFGGAQPLRSRSAGRLDYQLGGDGLGRVRGRTVKQEDKASPKVPVARRVRLYREHDGLLVRQAWSSAQGEYDFQGLDSKTAYTVLSYDYEGNFRAVVADRVTPEAMP